MNAEIKDTFTWYKIVCAMINSLNNKDSDWKEDILVDYALHKINGYNFTKLTPLNGLSYLELIRLTDEFEKETEKVMDEIKYGIVDNNGKLVAYDESVDYIYTTNYIEQACLLLEFEEATSTIDYLIREYNDGILGKHPELEFPLRVVKVEMNYEITETNTLLD